MTLETEGIYNLPNGPVAIGYTTISVEDGAYVVRVRPVGGVHTQSEGREGMAKVLIEFRPQYESPERV